MGAFAKLKLLFKYRKPLGQVAQAIGQAKKGWKTIAFWTTLVATCLTTVGALQGVIPPQAMVIATSVLTGFYNVLRGLQKAETPEIKGTLRTTEFGLTVLGEVQKTIVAIQSGGVNPEWLTTAATISAVTFGIGQNLAARYTKAEVPMDAPAAPAPKKAA